ncbi:hypothetical protein [Streptomyces sp. NPDC047070]|uniref:hypothetical protein n=1 Tax=Streptomyces sp. NPDC047070 TaxID=3154923 RepID=UPI0034511B2A
MILDRTGGTITAADILTEVEWTRVLDDISTGRVVINPNGDCCERLGQVRSWRHRLFITRDGKPVWDGPITNVDWRLGEIEIFAVDLLGWLDRRVPHNTKAFANADMAEIAEWLIDDGFFPDDPGHSVQIVANARVRGSRNYTKNIGQTGDHLRDLADSGLDYTAIGSTIVLLPEDHRAVVGRLTDADMPEGLVVAEDGAALATRWVVAGDDSGAILGEAGGIDPYYGLLEKYVEQSNIPDVASATSAAAARLRTTGVAPVFIDTREVTISPQAAVDIDKLVPGWCLDITSGETCRTVTQRLKIVGVQVSETGGSGDTPGAESVQVQVAASGAEVNP